MTAYAPLVGHGFSVQLPAAWEGRIYRRETPTATFAPENSHGPNGAGRGRMARRCDAGGRPSG